MSRIRIKQFFFALCFVFLTVSLYAQDLIVTDKGDSLNCKITKIETDNIYFTFKYKGEIRNTLAPVSDVTYYQTGYYQTAEVPSDKIPIHRNYPRFRFAVNGGWSYRIGPLPPNISSGMSDYLQELKSGFYYDAGLSYYFNEYLGAGLRYSEHLSSNSDDGSIGYGSMSDRIRINFIGPVFSTRLFNRTKKNCLLLDLGMGYLGYHDKALIASEKLTLKGGTAGFYWNIGYDIGISQNLALGLQLSLISGFLFEYKRSNGTYTEVIKLDKDTRENLSQIALSVGLRFSK
ncbi:MAG: hypothetical protein LBL58_15040 [Tannerellaceae bacterium]|jgi:hypothetical protein|nr:hypothetical protein [Tannerellaceae bacterium]